MLDIFLFGSLFSDYESSDRPSSTIPTPQPHLTHTYKASQTPQPPPDRFSEVPAEPQMLPQPKGLYSHSPID